MDKLFKIEPFHKFSQVCDTILDNLIQQDTLQTSHDVLSEATGKQIRELLWSTHGDVLLISNNLLSMGFEEKKVNYLVGEIEKKKSELLYLILLHYKSQHGATVVAFDWALKLVFGTSDLKTLRYPILQLAFKTINNSDKHEEKLCDLNKNMLAKLISTLENIV
ncbi:unnamed protein product [Leptosia nina]|uniref:COMM domain-containing protein n=1 Tax=Leptosia nina TaxID=320188 RepID=A0AAV1IWC7_9NEOP